MKLAWKGLLVLVACAAVLVGTTAAWLFFYIADLPRTSELREFAPDHVAHVRLRSCDGHDMDVIALPTNSLGKYTVAALTAAEGVPEAQSPLRTLLDDLVSGGFQHPSGQYSVWVARTLACDERRTLRRGLKELRIAHHIYREFPSDELMTIYLNRAYFGEGAFGIAAASTQYFGKPASDLTLEQAATLAGIIRSPRRYSPTEHHDRALERRNVVLDQMVQNGSIRGDEAARAKATLLNVNSVAH